MKNLLQNTLSRTAKTLSAILLLMVSGLGSVVNAGIRRATAMKVLAFVAALIVLCGCASQGGFSDNSYISLSQARSSVDGRFNYKADPDGSDVWVMPPEDGEFAGDCEEFAMAIHQRIESVSVWALQKNNGLGHAIACDGLWCVDNETPAPFKLNPKKYKLMIKMTDPMISGMIKKGSMASGLTARQ